MKHNYQIENVCQFSKSISCVYANKKATVIIQLSPGGLFKTRPSRGGIIREGALIQKEAFLRGDLFETHYNFWRVRRTVDYYFHQPDYVCWKMDW